MLKDFTLYYKKYLKMIAALLLVSIAYNIFVRPINLIAGGSGGLGILLYNIAGIDPSIVIFFVSFTMFILAFVALDAEDVLSCFVEALVFPTFVKTTSYLANVVTFDSKNMLVVVVFGAILTGIGHGIIFGEGLNVGGLSVLAKVIHKYTKLSVTYCNAMINAIIIALGAFFISVGMVLYAIIYVVILRYVSERIVLGTSNNKTFNIISSKYAKIEKYIHSIGHDVTLYDTVGSYKGDNKKLIMTVVPTSEFILLRDYVKSVDKKAFIFITNTYDVSMQDQTIRKAEE
jgi:uncharacterized membrane-anchored protein YitT (DUF2179 family)